jgi:outer membrane protein, multidrug efflux system
MRFHQQTLLLAPFGLLLSACAVGPDYKGPPDSSATPTFVRAPAATPAAEPPAKWWSELHDAELDRLVEQAVAANPSVDSAIARLREARAAFGSEQAKLLPTTGLGAAYLRSHNFTSALAGSAGSSSDVDIYAVGFDATWEIDIFGAQRRAAEGAAAALGASRANLTDVVVSLTAEVAQSYVALRDAQQQLAQIERNAAIESQLLRLMQVRRSAGTASDLDVTRTLNQLQSAQAQIPSLNAQVIQQMNHLAQLTGRAPGALDDELRAAAPVPSPPATVPVGDPATLLRRRPDIAAAERKLAQQTAVVGQRVAAYFPKLTLLGELGFTAMTPGALFNGGSFSYVAAPLLQWTPFDFGRTRAQVAQARAAREEAEADYRHTVLEALEDAESALARYGEQRNAVIDRANVQASAEQAYALTAVRLRAGTASTTDLLDADATRLEAELGYEQAVAQLTEYYIALQKSLGLGWIAPAEGRERAAS